MNQYQWTFLDNARRRHTLGIAHGARSGNLVVHCNAQIVKIDFSVLEPRTYSFFVEEELCHLAIEGTKEDGFKYNFHIDTEADTPVNRERHLRRVTTRRQGWLAAIAMAIVVFGLIGGVTYWGYSTKQASLQRELYVTGVPASARFLPTGAIEFVGGRRVVSEAPLPQDVTRLAALPTEGLAEVPVRYYTGDPGKFVVDWRAVFAEVASDADARARRATSAAAASPAVAAVLSGLSSGLPSAAGEPACALRAAGALGSFRNQISLLDAYVVGDEVALERWSATFETPAYRRALRGACPPPAE